MNSVNRWTLWKATVTMKRERPMRDEGTVGSVAQNAHVSRRCEQNPAETEELNEVLYCDVEGRLEKKLT